MKITVDCIVPHKKGHMAYLHVLDDAGRLIGTESVYYDEGREDDFRAAVVRIRKKHEAKTGAIAAARGKIESILEEL